LTSPPYFLARRPGGGVTERGGDVREVTAEASYRAEKSNIVAVSLIGVVSTVGNGSTKLRIRFNKQTVLIPVTVSDVAQHAPVSFNMHVQPILAAVGCSSAAVFGVRKVNPPGVHGVSDNRYD
jgi:hypothetical protein